MNRCETCIKAWGDGGWGRKEGGGRRGEEQGWREEVDDSVGFGEVGLRFELGPVHDRLRTVAVWPRASNDTFHRRPPLCCHQPHE